MGNEREFHPGSSPLEYAKLKKAEDERVDIEEAKKETIIGLINAIAATKRKIEEYKAKNWDFSGFELHLISLEQQLEKARNAKTN